MYARSKKITAVEVSSGVFMAAVYLDSDGGGSVVIPGGVHTFLDDDSGEYVDVKKQATLKWHSEKAYQNLSCSVSADATKGALIGLLEEIVRALKESGDGVGGQ